MKPSDRRTTSTILALATAILLLVGLSAGGCGGSGLEQVSLDSGPVTGAQEEVDGGQLWVFKGIPYAAPPVGELRWKAPQPVAPWTEPRTCTDFGAACPQPASFGMDVLSPGAMDEDCLYLNVWSPADSPDEKLPVMVWIHGGSFQTGSGSLGLYYGGHLAARGAVVVTINYRLGPLGFLSHPALSAESMDGTSGDYGLMDQIAALRWVQRNIGGFGGDPLNVTVFGESAGAISILHLLVSPPAEGLFQKAIVQSGIMLDQGFGVTTTATREQGETAGEDFVRRLGVDASGDVLGQMRALSVEQLLAAADEIAGETPTVEQSLMWKPVVDGVVVPELPTKLWLAGSQQKVPLLVGSNADEAELFLQGLDMSAPELEALVRRILGDHAGEALALYPISTAADPMQAFSRLFTEIGFSSTARFAASRMSSEVAPAYLYEFTRVPFDNVMGAFHAVELPYVFGTTGLFSLMGPIEQADTDLSVAVMGYWTRFAATGDPNGDGAPEWPKYYPTTDRHLELGDAIATGGGLYEQGCDLADRARALE